jgi:hypothetical protein
MKSTETKQRLDLGNITTLIGIDPGVNTGLAVIENKRLVLVASPAPSIIHAMEQVKRLAQIVGSPNLLVIYEDARMIGGMNGMARGSKGDNARLRGVGSVQRDCAIWAEFLDHQQIKAAPMSPAAKGAKLDDAQFLQVTGWTPKTNQHSRDAAMLIWPKRGLTITLPAKAAISST